MNVTSKYNKGDIVWFFFMDENDKVRFIKGKILGLYNYDPQVGFGYNLLLFNEKIDTDIANTITYNCRECNIYHSKEEILNEIFGIDYDDSIYDNNDIPSEEFEFNY